MITLGNLKPRQLREYFVTDVHGNELNLLLSIPFDKKTIGLLVKTFESCKFKKLDMIIKHNNNQVECKFINLKVSKYNPVNDNDFMLALVSMSKKLPSLKEDTTVYLAKLSVFCGDRTDKKKFKISVATLLIEIVQSYIILKNRYIRVAAYDIEFSDKTKQHKLSFEIKLIPGATGNEIYTDEL